MVRGRRSLRTQRSARSESMPAGRIGSGSCRPTRPFWVRAPIPVRSTEWRMRSAGTIRSHQRGSTLIELLVALILLAIGASALAGGMRSATRSAASGRAWSLGAFTAESRLEQLRARCVSTNGSLKLGPVLERWATGPAAGPMLPSFEVEDSISLTLSAGSAGRTVRSIARCQP